MIPEDIIKQKLMELEAENNIKILFCVESGSRAWGIDSKDSDYDVRYVYKRPIDEYLVLSPRADVIRTTYDSEGNKAPEEGCSFDLVGFDILKFARMLQSSNPQVIEWLTSDIPYYGEKSKTYVDYAINQFKPISLYFHYKSMCRQNYLKYLKTRSVVTYKKYLYAMRGLVNAKYVALFNKVPPINFQETIKLMTGQKGMPDEVINRLWEAIKYKKEGKEKDNIPNIPELDQEIESFLKDDAEAPTNKKLATTYELDNEVIKTIKEGF